MRRDTDTPRLSANFLIVSALRFLCRSDSILAILACEIPLLWDNSSCDIPICSLKFFNRRPIPFIGICFTRNRPHLQYHTCIFYLTLPIHLCIVSNIYYFVELFNERRTYG